MPSRQTLAQRPTIGVTQTTRKLWEENSGGSPSTGMTDPHLGDQGSRPKDIEEHWNSVEIEKIRANLPKEWKICTTATLLHGNSAGCYAE